MWHLPRPVMFQPFENYFFSHFVLTRIDFSRAETNFTVFTFCLSFNETIILCGYIPVVNQKLFSAVSSIFSAGYNSSLHVAAATYAKTSIVTDIVTMPADHKLVC